MAIRIDVLPTIPDARAEIRRKAFREIAPKAAKVRIADSYTIDAALSKTGLQKARLALTNPRIEKSVAGRWLPPRFSFAIEVGYLPGVTDNVGATARETIEDATKRAFTAEENVYSSQTFFIEGPITRHEAERIAASLHNPLIQSADVYDASLRKRKSELRVPRVALSGSSKVLSVDLDIPDEELESLGKLGVLDEGGRRRGPLGLDLEALQAIRAHYQTIGRLPTDVEIESFAQTWSEHCKHTIFASAIDSVEDGLYKTYIKGATSEIRKKKGAKDFCVSVFKDNAGGIEFDDEYVITHKVETHNTPSALDPFGGAITGVVGVNRDALGFGMGAKPVANVYGFCFAPPDDTRRLFRDREGKEEMLSARRIAEGVIAGINAGGNQSGIPTPHGFMLFDESYRGKPLVFAGTVGLIPKKLGARKLYEKKAKPGDYIVMVGGRVGLDGIHGATFSSTELHEGSPATAVQIGDPITQKKFSDAIAKEARDLGLYTSITDNGAGGLSSSVGEMARESGGCRVDLEKVPLKYPGLEPWQVWISESQERMTLAAPKKKWRALRELLRRRGVEATVIGEFTKTGRCVIRYNGKAVMDVSLEFLHDGLPEKRLRTKKPERERPEEASIEEPKDFSHTLLSLLSRLNLASHEFLARQFDHEVQGGSVVKPVQGAGRVTGDASVFLPRLDSRRAALLTSALYPYYAELDPYRMAAAAVDSAVRQAVAGGADLDHLALLDNFCWASSDEPERLWQLKEAARACHDYAIRYGTPYISGKDSMFNDFKGYDEKGDFIKISALPTLLISALGVMKSADRAVSIDAKAAGDYVYLLGETRDEFGGSEYLRMRGERTMGIVPDVDAHEHVKRYRAFQKANAAGLIASAVSVGRGGLAFALARSALAGGLGIEADLSELLGSVSRADSALFSESQGRIVITVAPEQSEEFEKLFLDVPLKRLGAVTEKPSLILSLPHRKEARVSLQKAIEAYRSTFEGW